MRRVSANENNPSHGTHRDTQNTESKMEFFLNENSEDLKLQAGAWVWTECHRRPILFGKIKKVTEVMYKRERGPGPSVTGFPFKKSHRGNVQAGVWAWTECHRRPIQKCHRCPPHFPKCVIRSSTVVPKRSICRLV